VTIRYVLIRDLAGKFSPQVLLSTDPTLSPEQILAYFICRWQMETTFQQVRTHLGVETQRQWSDKAIARITPILLGLFSLVTLLANALILRKGIVAHPTAWYSKTLPNQWCGSLKRKLGNRKRDKAVLVGRQTVPLNKQVKQTHCVG